MDVEATFSDLFLGGGGFGGELSYISDGFVLFNSRNKTELSNIVSVAAKTSSRFFDGFCKFSNKVAIPESKCLFGNRDGRLTRVAQLLLHDAQDCVFLCCRLKPKGTHGQTRGLSNLEM